MSFRGPLRDVVIPDESLFDFLFADLDDHDAERPALIDGDTGETMTYGQLVATIRGVAAGIAARGLSGGDVIALYSPNNPAFAAVLHGILRAGCTVTTVDTLCTPADIAHQLRDCGARLVFTVGALSSCAVQGAQAAGLFAADVVLIDSVVDDRHVGLPGFIALACASGGDVPAVVADPGSHLAALSYASGTTGPARGVMLTHRNLVANVCQIEEMMRLDRHDRVPAVLPFSHGYGMTVLLNAALRRRATLITRAGFELSAFLRTVSDFECTYLFIAPSIAVALARNPLVDEYDLSSVHTVACGSAPLPGALARAVARRLDCRVRQSHGLPETSPISHAIPAESDDIDLDSVGFTVPNMECRLVDPQTGADIDPPAHGISAPGELWCRGPNVMAGYLGAPEATAEKLDADGFLRTGDIATVDHRGVVTIVAAHKNTRARNSTTRFIGTGIKELS
ncbi:putative fatty-acid--CoA ligase [Nocardia nova SH22a]|uniref:Putative fatty-acid--CoA ligase n=1 Tax=Nocardia nova SH22a TaxID=1415166 RepID=W5TGZ4_9NOCA|nr:AMP-binding protein [Nocardia nova]AHH18467.1 putative fatty-acid--CoA ligase [Nocardia nova SH22a]